MTSRVNRRSFLALRRALRLLLMLPVRWRFSYRVVGAALPVSRQPMILVCNHAALIDTLFLVLAVRPRFVVCGAKPKYFRSPLLRFLMATANILKVTSREAFLRDTLELLGRGEMLLIYPEMGRNADAMGVFDTLAAEVALAADVPIQPCYLHGTTKGHEGGVRLIVGERLDARGDAGELTGRLCAAIEGLAAMPVEVERQ